MQCVNASMDTLTLARYFCEMSLMDMELVVERGSLLASACLLMALVTKDLGGWVGPVHPVKPGPGLLRSSTITYVLLQFKTGLKLVQF